MINVHLWYLPSFPIKCTPSLRQLLLILILMRLQNWHILLPAEVREYNCYQWNEHGTWDQKSCFYGDQYRFGICT